MALSKDSSACCKKLSRWTSSIRLNLATLIDLDLIHLLITRQSVISDLATARQQSTDSSVEAQNIQKLRVRNTVVVVRAIRLLPSINGWFLIMA